LYKMVLLKKIGFILFLLLILRLSDNNVVSSNQYLTTNTHQIVTVTSGDSVWSIATKYVSDKDDIRDFIAAIKHINHLDNNVQIFPGQFLKIPLPNRDMNIAQK
jgi:LysM repeat protein